MDSVKGDTLCRSIHVHVGPGDAALSIIVPVIREYDVAGLGVHHVHVSGGSCFSLVAGAASRNDLELMAKRQAETVSASEEDWAGLLERRDIVPTRLVKRVSNNVSVGDAREHLPRF